MDPTYPMCAHCGAPVMHDDPYDWDEQRPFCGSYCWQQWVEEAMDDD